MKVVNEKEITVERWVRDWQREYRSYIKESTFATYSVVIENHILPYFGKKKLESIDHDDNQNFILFLSQKGKKNGSGTLSHKSVKDIMALWMGILEKAEKKGYICLGKMQYQYPKTNAVMASEANGNYLTL